MTLLVCRRMKERLAIDLKIEGLSVLLGTQALKAPARALVLAAFYIFIKKNKNKNKNKAFNNKSFRKELATNDAKLLTTKASLTTTKSASLATLVSRFFLFYFSSSFTSMHRPLPGGSAPSANRPWLAWPKGMRTNDLNF